APQEITPTPVPTQIEAANPVYNVQRGEIVSKIEFLARVTPVVQQDLFFKTDGRVRNLYVENKQAVKAGEVIADLEIDALERQLAVTELDIQTCQEQLAIARLNLEWSQQQFQTKQQKYEVQLQEHEVKLAEIALKKASLNVDDLKKAIADAQVISPMDGVVISIGFHKGSEVKAYQPVVQVADLNNVELSAEPGNEIMQKMQEGMPVSAIFYGRPGTPLPGSIRRLPTPYGSGNPAVDGEQDKSTRITLDSLPKNSELGDLLSVTVTLDRRENALWLPVQAVRTFEGRKFVLVQEGQGQRRVDVKLGLQGEDRVEILEGLTEGQVVIGP
ncbi:MAG: efflux RND transporter periplasmic adaptor subunit, partial [Omnitrophica WOR_2 bacterium]